MKDAVSDQVAWALAGKGDPNGLAVLYDRHASLMFRIARQLLHNRRDAEDLLHDVFLEAWHKAGQYDAQRGSVRSWLILRIRSRAIDRIRSAAVARKYAAEMATLADTLLVTTDHSESDADAGRARRALDGLKSHQREVVELGYFEGLTCREISERCKIPVGTVKSRLSAGIAALRQQLVAASEASDVNT